MFSWTRKKINVTLCHLEFWRVWWEIAQIFKMQLENIASTARVETEKVGRYFDLSWISDFRAIFVQAIFYQTLSMNLNKGQKWFIFVWKTFFIIYTAEWLHNVFNRSLLSLPVIFLRLSDYIRFHLREDNRTFQKSPSIGVLKLEQVNNKVESRLKSTDLFASLIAVYRFSQSVAKIKCQST